MKKFSIKFNIFLSIFLLVGVTFSIVSITKATTPNPGHSWSQTGDGVFAITGPTTLRTFTLPDANDTIATLGVANVFVANQSFSGNVGIGGTITSGLINSQTISSSANFTGTMNIFDNVGIGTTTPNILGATGGKKVLTIAGASNYGVLELANTQGDVAASTGLIAFSMPTNTGGNGTPVAEILGASIGSTANDKGGYLTFYIKPDGGALARAMRINTSGGVGIGSAYALNDPGANNLIVQGNLGIGTNTPSSKLEVNGDMRIKAGSGGALIFADGTSINTSSIPGSAGSMSNISDAITTGDSDANGTGDVILKTGSNDRLHILNNGNVGVGTAVPGAALHVSGAGNTILRIDSSGTTTNPNLQIVNDIGTGLFMSIFGSTNGGTRYGLSKNNLSVLENGSNGPFVVGTTSAQPLILGTSYLERMRIDTNGNVGIGTTAPDFTLDVVGGIRATDGLSAYNQTANSTPYFELWQGAGNGTTGNGYYLFNVEDTTGDLLFENFFSSSFHTIWQAKKDSTDFILTGNVGIGTMTPVNALDTVGYIRALASSANGGGTGKGVEIIYGSISDNGYINSYDRDIGAFKPLTLQASTISLMQGNVGIGTTNPTAKLDIDATTANLVLRLNSTSATGPYMSFNKSGVSKMLIGDSSVVQSGLGYDFMTQSGLGMTFFTDAGTGGARLAITSGGNVGIGTTNPGELLHVFGVNKYFKLESSGNTTALKLKTAQNEWALASGYSLGNANFEIFDITDSQSRFTIDTTGNVGIGTTGPNTKLEVAGTATIATFGYTPTNNAGESLLQIIGSGVSSAKISLNQTWNNSKYPANIRTTPGTWVGAAGVDMAFDTSNYVEGTVERMRITDSGNVGIGTTSPNYKLDVNGGANINGTLNATGLSSIGTILSYIQNRNATGGGLEIATWGTSASDLALSVTANSGSTKALSVTNAGNVGIGTTNPGAKLEVLASVADSGIEALRLNVSSGYARGRPDLSWYSNNGAYVMGTIGVEQGDSYVTPKLYLRVSDSSKVLQDRMVIDSTGNVGIGTTGPGAALDIYSAVTSKPMFRVATDGTANGWVFNSAGSDRARVTLNGYSGATKTIYFDPEPAVASYINAGNVGIGTTGPNSILSIPGLNGAPNGRIVRFINGDGATSRTNGAVQIVTAAPGGSALDVGVWDLNGGGWAFRAFGNSDRVENADVGGTFLFGVKANGAVEIGTTRTPNAKLNLDSDLVNLTGIDIKNTGAGNTGAFIAFDNSTGGTAGSITHTGAITVAYNTSSDQRLKENIVPTHYGLTDLMNIQVSDYSFISDPNHIAQNGFIAQQLNTVYPNAVTVGGDDFNKNPWMVDYGRLTPLLVKSIQELNLNLESIIQPIPTINSLGERFFSNLFTRLIAWFADSANGITNIFAKKATLEEVCLKNTNGTSCYTRDQLDALLLNSGNGNNSGSSGSGSNLSDISALTIAKATAQGLIDTSAIESGTPGEHIVGSLTILIEANTKANATTADTQTVIDEQVATLNTAIDTYNTSIVLTP